MKEDNTSLLDKLIKPKKSKKVAKKKVKKVIKRVKVKSNKKFNNKHSYTETYEYFLKNFGRQISVDFHKYIGEEGSNDLAYLKDSKEYAKKMPKSKIIEEEYIVPSLINDFCRKYKIKITTYLSNLDRMLLEMFYQSIKRKAIEQTPGAARSIELYLNNPVVELSDKAIIECTEIARLFFILIKLTGNATYEQQYWHWGQIGKGIKARHRAKDKDYIDKIDDINHIRMDVKTQEHIHAIINLIDIIDVD